MGLTEEEEIELLTLKKKKHLSGTPRQGGDPKARGVTDDPAGAEGTTLKKDVQKDSIKDYLISKGVPGAGVAGIMANIDIETGGSFDYEQKQIGGPGRGLFQLDPSGPLPKTYSQYLKGGEDSAESQIDFMLDTIYGSNQSVIGEGHAKKLRDVIQSGSAEDIAEEFSNRWERPSKPHMKRRREAAAEHFKALSATSENDTTTAESPDSDKSSTP